MIIWGPKYNDNDNLSSSFAEIFCPRSSTSPCTWGAACLFLVKIKEHSNKGSHPLKISILWKSFIKSFCESLFFYFTIFWAFKTCTKFTPGARFCDKNAVFYVFWDKNDIFHDFIDTFFWNFVLFYW